MNPEDSAFAQHAEHGESRDRDDRPFDADRRRLIRLGLALPFGIAIAGCSGDDQARNATGPAGSAAAAPPTTAPSPGSGSGSGPLRPTPSCADADDATEDQTAGPFFTPGSPERADIREPGMAGVPLTLAGFVVDTGCRPVARALLDFWQADDGGEYDNAGTRLRGHQFAAADGSFRLATIVPGLYTGRTRHIHVKVQPPGGSVLTTQLYFPDEPGNSRDGIFDRDLQLRDYFQRGSERTATFTFVLA